MGILEEPLSGEIDTSLIQIPEDDEDSLTMSSTDRNGNLEGSATLTPPSTTKSSP